MIRAGAYLTVAILLMLAAMAAKSLLIALPAPAAQVAAGQFDANRAQARLQRVLGDQSPHPVDIAASDAVRARLITEMRRAGLNPRVTDDFVCNGFARARAVACAQVRNLVATVGPREGRHLLLSAHYDSTFAGPGAGDAGIGVATLLEIAALLDARQLRRPVTFLFNEGEEMGLLGARAFLDRDPIAGTVDTALNIEARGVSGPAIMFETSRPNGAAIALYESAVGRPAANSLTTDLYGLLPNSTDVAVFTDRPWTILNFAIIGNETRYHSAGDNLAALDRRSLRHMGDQVLALTRTIGATAATERLPGTSLYTDLVGRTLFVTPLLVGLAALGVLILVLLWKAYERRALGRAIAWPAAAFVGSAAFAWLGQLVLGAVRAGDYWRGYPLATNTAVYASALAAALAALMLIARNVEVRRLRAGYWLFFSVVAAAISWIAPGGAILFLPPALAAAIGMAGAGWRRWLEPAGAWIAILLAFLVLGPALGLFEELMSNGPHWMFAPIGALILLPALIELKPLVDRLSRTFVIAGAGDLLVLPWLVVAFVPAYSEDRRQLFTIEYALDADAGTARWAINSDGARLPALASWERIELPYTQRRRWTAPAPAQPLAGPIVQKIAEQGDGDRRLVRLRLAANGAEQIALIAPADAPLRRAGAPGQLRAFGRGAPTDRFVLRCVGRACDGALLDLEIGGAGPVEFTLIGTRSGLPASGEALGRARPRDARPQYAPDSSIVYRRVPL
jgi:hypothetical protein